MQTAGWSYAPLTATAAEDVRASVEVMKARDRGPFERLRWFCADGAVLEPRPYACADHGGGRQHGEYTADANRLHALGFHVGPVLAATGWETFNDLANSHYYLRELVLQRFLEGADDGWVMREARFYRGSRQAEDEEAAGRALLEQLLSDGAWVERNYLLATSVVAAVPHGTAGVAGEDVRGLALQISDDDPGFMRLRVKIHSSPGPDDLPAVASYRANLPAGASAQVRARLAALEAALARMYSTGLDPADWVRVAAPLSPVMRARVAATPDAIATAAPGERVAHLAELARALRPAVLAASKEGRGNIALALLDASHFVSGRLFSEANAWVTGIVAGPSSRRQLLDAAGTLLDAAYGDGWLTAREWQALGNRLDGVASEVTLTRSQYLGLSRYLGRSMEWGTAAAKHMVALAEQRYAAVEPLALRFSDDAVRGSVLLALAQVLNAIESDAASEAGLSYALGDVTVSTGVMGLNPGAAFGVLHIIENPGDIRNLDPDAIYILPETPADLGRIAGILTIDQGSRLSHVQLLARGLGIPNAAVASVHLDLLRGLAGREVLYAVSPLGSVLVQPTEQVSAATLAKFRQDSATNAPRVTIDTSVLDLETQRVLPLESIAATDSGRLAGPKAANLGQLHQLFPNRVAPGLVVPFGVFRAHVDRDLDGDGRSLYEEAAAIYASNAPRDQMVRELAGVADKVRNMPLIPSFERELLALMRTRFELAGVTGVFVRSDTNVEDLRGFSGAGLNLTVMNVVGEAALLQAIRDVWASPYRARSYEWRQRIVTNPEAVYPSIVILGSVPAEASGVLVTRDVDGALMGDPELGPADAWTATVAAGVGGAVDGEAAETLLLPARDGAFEPRLLSSARAAWRKALVPSGGMRDLPVFGDVTLLTPTRLQDLNEVIRSIQTRYPDDEGGTAWDVEFGFLGDDTVLFQIRPFIVGGASLTEPQELRDMDATMLAGASIPVALAGEAR
jgi:hypothetical protein